MSIRSVVNTEVVDRDAVIEWFLRNRRRSRMLFDLIDDEAYYSRPIAVRNPVVFYEGHLPVFSVNTLLKRALSQQAIDPELERLFARGIDPEHEDTSVPSIGWPTREAVRAYAAAADAAVLHALRTAELERPGDPLLGRGAAVYAILEHEAMHQETLLYMWHRLPYEWKTRPDGGRPRVDGIAPAPDRLTIPAGRATLGADPAVASFGWDNEFPATVVTVPAFTIDRHNVTNLDYLEFVETGGYERQDLWSADGWHWRTTHAVRHPLFWERRDRGWLWHGMFEAVPLPLSWPVYVTHAEASAYARWKRARLPTEAEFHRAAYGVPEGHERTHPWGEEPPDPGRGNFDFQQWDPVPAGSYPEGCSAWGLHDLVGNGWEWTETVFAPFPGFSPIPSYPEYSVDFFDGRHYVLKGASPATARELVRRSFRNWFRPCYPYVYATFRCVWDASA